MQCTSQSTIRIVTPPSMIQNDKNIIYKIKKNDLLFNFLKNKNINPCQSPWSRRVRTWMPLKLKRLLNLFKLISFLYLRHKNCRVLQWGLFSWRGSSLMAKKFRKFLKFNKDIYIYIYIAIILRTLNVFRSDSQWAMQGKREKHVRRTRMDVVSNAMSAWGLALWAC